MNDIVRSVDVGRGNTKFILSVDGTTPKCSHFPSVTHASEQIREQDSMGGRRKTIAVPLDSLMYEIGPDVRLSADVFNAEVLQHDSYCMTPEYFALTMGALHYMQVEMIDLLIVGLPVSTFKQRKVVAALEKRLEGEHELGRKRKVVVKKVKVLAQPSGALMYYGSMNDSYSEIRKQKSLIIDVGRRTFDWIVTQGMMQVQKQSHSVNRGMFDVLQTIATGISDNTCTDYRDYDAIDNALRMGTKPVIFQSEYPISRHMPLARKIPEQAVAEMLHYVGDAADISNIILVGGASFFFKGAVKKAFPRHRIVDVKESLYANVLGFQLAGLELTKGMKLAAREAVNE